MKKRIGSINAQPKAKLQVLPFPLTCVFSFVSFFTHDVKKTTFLVGFCLPDSFDLSLLLIGRKKKQKGEASTPNIRTCSNNHLRNHPHA